MINNYLNTGLRDKISKQAEAFGLKGSQALDVISLTKNAIKEELQAEIHRGQYKSVAEFLQKNALRYGKDILYDKIIQRVASRLIIRLGLPGGLAVTVASYLVPVLLKSIGKKVITKNNLQNFLTSFKLPPNLPGVQKVKNIVSEKFKKPAVD